MAAGPVSPLEAAESQLESGQYGEAGASLGQYYDSLSPELQASQTGEFIVMRAADAYDQAYEAEGAREHLEASETLLARFVAGVGPDDALATRPNERLASVRARLEETKDTGAAAAAIAEVDDDVAESNESNGEDDAAANDESPESEPAAEPSPPERDAPPMTTGPRDTNDDAPASRDRLGLGLTIGGIGGIALGAGLIGWGVAYESRAEDNLEERGGSSSDDEAYLQDAEKVRNGLLIPGVAIATLGAGALILGAVRLARARRKGSTAWRVAPSVSPRFTGLVLRGTLPSRAHR